MIYVILTKSFNLFISNYLNMLVTHCHTVIEASYKCM